MGTGSNYCVFLYSRHSWYRHTRHGAAATEAADGSSFSDIFRFTERSNSVRFKLRKDTAAPPPPPPPSRKHPMTSANSVDESHEDNDSQIHFLTPRKCDSLREKTLTSRDRQRAITNSLSSPDYTLLPSIVVDSCGMDTALRNRCEVCHHDNALCCSNKLRQNATHS